MSRTPQGTWPPALIAAMLPIAAGLTFSGGFQDDAYISLRFARNIGDGFLLQWNPGLAPVEGFSNPVWTLLLAPIAQFDRLVDTTLFWTIVGLLSLWGVAVVLLAKRVSGVPGAWFGLLAFAAVLALPGFWDGALNGMETALYAAALFTATAVVVANPAFVPLGTTVAVLLFVVTVRFEGVIAAVLLAAAFWAFRRRRRASARSWLPLLAVATYFAALSAVRVAVYGSPIPLSVRAKSINWVGLTRAEGLDELRRVASRTAEDGVAYLTDFLAHPASIGLLLAGAIGVSLLWRRAGRLGAVLVGSVPLAGFTIAVANGGDWMPGFRLLFPYAGVLIAIIVGTQLPRVIARTVAVPSAGTAAAATIIALAIASVVLPGGLAALDSPAVLREFESAARRSGEYWNSVLEPDEVYVAAAAGALPYAAQDMQVLDYHGLVDPCVGRSGYRRWLTGRRNWGCTFGHEPAVLDANNEPFARKVSSVAKTEGYEVVVAMCGRDGPLTRGRLTFFAARSMVDTLRARDPLFRWTTVEAWESDPEYTIDRAACVVAE